MCDGKTGGETWLGAPSGGALKETPWGMWKKNGPRYNSGGRETTPELRSSKIPGERTFPLKSCPRSTWSRVRLLGTSPGLPSLLNGLPIPQSLQIHGSNLPIILQGISWLLLQGTYWLLLSLLSLGHQPLTAQNLQESAHQDLEAPLLVRDPVTEGGHTH